MKIRLLNVQLCNMIRFRVYTVCIYAINFGQRMHQIKNIYACSCPVRRDRCSIKSDTHSSVPCLNPAPVGEPQPLAVKNLSARKVSETNAAAEKKVFAAHKADVTVQVHAAVSPADFMRQ